MRKWVAVSKQSLTRYLIAVAKSRFGWEISIEPFAAAGKHARNTIYHGTHCSQWNNVLRSN